jgi:hypothetical protein
MNRSSFKGKAHENRRSIARVKPTLQMSDPTLEIEQVYSFLKNGVWGSPRIALFPRLEVGAMGWRIQGFRLCESPVRRPK